MKGLVFEADSVRDILAGTKTQTRRVIKQQPVAENVKAWVIADSTDGLDVGKWRFLDANDNPVGQPFRPRHAFGDVLYVKESWECLAVMHDTLKNRHEAHVYYAADNENIGKCPTNLIQVPKSVQDSFERNKVAPWRSPLCMPQWAARIWLEITGVRVQRLQDINDADVAAEGCEGWYSPCHPDMGCTDGQTPMEEFAARWNTVNGKQHSWSSNPWVAAYAFKRVEKPR